MSEQQLVCPDCGEAQFSWIANIVQFGTVIEYDSGRRNAITNKNGDITGTDIGESGVYCTGCDEDKEMSELEPAE